MFGLTGGKGEVAMGMGARAGGIPDEGVTGMGTPVGGMVGIGDEAIGGVAGCCSATKDVGEGTGGSEGISGKPG